MIDTTLTVAHLQALQDVKNRCDSAADDDIHAHLEGRNLIAFHDGIYWITTAGLAALEGNTVK